MVGSIALLITAVPPSLGAALFLCACLGHLCLMLASHNWWYGCPIPKRLGDAVHCCHGLLILAGPAALWWIAGLDLHGLFGEPITAGRVLLLAYVIACWLAGLVGLPFVTWRHWQRARPDILLNNHTRTEDVAALLGYPPRGQGRFRHLTRLPGNDVFRVDFSEKFLRLPRLPEAWRGLSILHLSDLHLNGTPDRRFFQSVMDLCCDWQPDIVAVTGDIVDDRDHYRWVVPVLGRLKWRIAAFAILGNHDQWYDVGLIRRRVRRCGLHLLGNSWTKIDVRGEPMVVIGNEWPWFKPAPDLSTCPPNLFKLCLSHTPDNIDWARANGIDLMLSGHVHGGQVRLPWFGSVIVPSRHGRKYDCGTFHEPPTVLHVSRGLSGEEPLRINCRPEVTKLILQPDEARKEPASRGA
jgi:predicted MPP superfamily phosphohydrolase